MAKKMDLSNFSLDKNTQVLKSDKKDVGRPTFKDADVEYTTITAHIPVATKKKLMLALATTFYDRYKTQAELINDALLAFIENERA